MLSIAVVVALVAVAPAGRVSSKWLEHRASDDAFVFGETTPVTLWTDADDVGRTCKHRRIDVVRETLRWIDTNDDACVDTDELRHAFNTCLSWYERATMSVGSAVGSVATPETIMADCDVDADGRMCIDDLVETQRSCRAGTGMCLCTCTPIEQLFDYVFERQPCSAADNDE